jgi:iodotyrosine deiodinase
VVPTNSHGDLCVYKTHSSKAGFARRPKRKNASSTRVARTKSGCGTWRPLGTDETKEFLTIAPWLVVVFQLTHTDDGGQVYYLKESVGLACGLFLAAAQHAGLATLTHTPSPMAFLGEVLGRPKHERPFLLIPVGYPADDCLVPAKALLRRPLDEVMVVV